MSHAISQIVDRDHAIEGVQGAQSLSDLFDRVNRALVERQAWGDDLASSRAAAQKWAGLFFPIDAVESELAIGGVETTRQAVLDMSLAAGKMAAKRLLAPLPSLDNDGAPISEAKRKERWAQASSEMSSELIKTVMSASGCKNLMAHNLFGFESLSSNPNREWEAAAHAKAWIEVEDKLLRPQLASLASACGASDKEAFTAQWSASSEDPFEVARLLSESGASFILAGPAGGFSVIAKGASLLRQNFKELAKITGLPLGVIGMGLEGWGLNMASTARVAYHSPRLRLMAFGHAPSGFGHEWTHLMDARIESEGNEAQKDALERLKKAPHGLGADPKVMAARSERLLKDKPEIFGWYLSDKGLDELKERHAIAPVEPNGEWSCDDAFLERAKDAVRKGEGAFVDFLQAARDPSKPEINMNGAKSTYEEMADALGVSEAPAVCDFVEYARIQDKLACAYGGYFESEKEMIARISESYFFKRGSGPSLGWDQDNARVNPKGAEEQALSAVYQELINTVIASPEALASPRARERLKEAMERTANKDSAPSLAIESEPALNLSAWRDQRSLGQAGALAAQSKLGARASRGAL